MVASVFILIGCVSGIHDSGESCKSSADCFKTLNYYTLLGSVHHQTAAAAKDAFKAQASYWQTRPHHDAKRHDAHMDAVRLHMERATELESHHSILDDHLHDLKKLFESSKQHAIAGLMQLDASNAKKAFELAKAAGDLPTSSHFDTQVIAHDKKSLDHTPPSAINFSAKMSIRDGACGMGSAELKRPDLTIRTSGKSDNGTPAKTPASGKFVENVFCIMAALIVLQNVFS